MNIIKKSHFKTKGNLQQLQLRYTLLRIVMITTCLMLFNGCEHILTDWYKPDFTEDEDGHPFGSVWTVESVKSYDDVRFGDLSSLSEELDLSIITTLWFNQETIWPSKYSESVQAILEAGKNPGLGVRALHDEGVTGMGVTVAIIDQNICMDHPEYSGKIIEYHDVGCNQPENEGSMHGPAVLSLLVGSTTGTAPGTHVYFVAAPSWTADAKYQADALQWIIDKNRTLSDKNKIRAVSISAAPSGPGSPFTKNNSGWDTARARAEQEGIIVLDCSSDHGKTAPCFYDLNFPDSLSKCTLGYSGISTTIDTTRLYIPTSQRTSAEEYVKGSYRYQYTGQGGLSWSIPYLTGVLALGWQLRPELSGKEMLDLAFASAYKKDGAKIINPVAFIDSVRSYQQ